jgi:hypothetical protein
MISALPTLHTWGRILAAGGGVFGVLVAVPAFRLGGVWKTCLRIAAFVLILGLSMLLEEQVLSSAGLSRIVKQPSLVGAIDESILTSSRTEDFGDHLVLPAVELRPFEHPILSVQPRKDGSVTRVVERSPRTPTHPGAGLLWPKPLSGGPSGGIIPHGKRSVKNRGDARHCS